MATRAHALFSYAASAVLLAGIAADSAGLITNRLPLWAAGARLLAAAVALAILAAFAGIFTRRFSTRFRAAVHTGAGVVTILVLALARWVRGHPEVQPDPPIFGAEIVAGVALLMLLRTGTRAGGGDSVVHAESRGKAEN